jgi:hypothetical protein
MQSHKAELDRASISTVWLVMGILGAWKTIMELQRENMKAKKKKKKGLQGDIFRAYFVFFVFFFFLHVRVLSGKGDRNSIS